ncbi:homoserine kinase [Dictyoglomus thermophilum]|uniref:Homoserine kinase n=2 Tax=Dictyoglomus thermophilum TaxID=14 RepID=B5YEX4_DICT6|nr:homoserine kinase [Dictyoglomus thermophilum]ACI18915.1 homoserine kinase [Dictyoglomus thermophilum H-6-12]
MKYLIKVPATSANLGPGFDTLGICWDLFLKIYVDLNSNEKVVINKNKQEIKKNDLFIQALNYTLEYLNIPNKFYKIELDSEIPIGKGLGSSAAAILGGISTAEIISTKKVDKIEKIKIALNFENHIDNLSACLEGGVVTCLKNENELSFTRLPIKCDIYGVIYIPTYTIATESARKILPLNYPKEDVIFNLQKLSFLITGLVKGDEDLIDMGMEDKIHQPYRFNLIKEYTLISELLNGKFKKKVVLSGAGPSLLTITLSYQKALEILKNLENNLRNEIEGTFRILKLNNKGIEIESL